MNFDWIVAIVTFLVFTIFSFNYYTAFFVYQADLSDAAGMINERVLDTIMVDSYSTPVYYNSTGPAAGEILYADFTWPPGTRNSTRIYLNDIQQPCLIQGDRIYWESDLVIGDNNFEMTFSDLDLPMICIDPLIIAGEVEATPWGMEKIRAISQADLNSLSLVEYNDYRNFISSSRDLRIELSNGFTYGPLTPKNIDVYVFERNTSIVETGEWIEIRGFVW